MTFGSTWSGRAAGLMIVAGMIAGSPLRAQASSGDALLGTVAALDAKLFTAYNTCDLKTLGSMVSDDLEFYHDQTGLAVGKAAFLESIQKYICGKVHRELTPGTLEAHPLKGFGAVEIGSHYFTHPGQPADAMGEAKFVMIWQNTDGMWKLTRVISYDHGPAAK